MQTPFKYQLTLTGHRKFHLSVNTVITWQLTHIKHQSFMPKNMDTGDSGNKTTSKVRCQHIT